MGPNLSKPVYFEPQISWIFISATKDIGFDPFTKNPNILVNYNDLTILPHRNDGHVREIIPI